MRRGNHDFFGTRVVTKAPARDERVRERDESSRSGGGAGIQVLSRPKEDPRQYRANGVTIVTKTAPVPAQSPRDGKADSQMLDSRKFVSEAMMLEEHVLEYLTENPHFTVTTAIGPQSAGKSTVLSMLAGNSPQDKYRYYVFRPASREAIESSRHQTTKIAVYVSKSRGIFLDCQATNCASLIEDAVRHSRAMKNEDRCEAVVYVECLQLVAFLLQISHTVLVCSEVTIDLELVKILRTAEMIRANMNNCTIAGMPVLNPARKVNIVFVHTRATSVDYSHPVNAERIRLIRAMFADSPRLRIPEDDATVVIKLAVLPPRRDTTTGMHLPPSENLLETEEVETFECGIRSMRLLIKRLPCDAFAEQTFTERYWFALARAIWKDSSFAATLERVSSLL